MQKMVRKKTERINSTIDSELEKEFRESVYKSLGFKRGNIQEALEEAITDWIYKKADISQPKKIKTRRM